MSPESHVKTVNNVSRRRFVTRGLAAAAGAAGLAGAWGLARRYGLVPPDSGGLFGPGETLTYAAQRLLTRHSLAREFSRGQIAKEPFANEILPPTAAFERLQDGGFKDWKIAVDGLVAHPASFSLDDIKRLPRRSQITQVTCEEGWSYVAEWIGAPLTALLDEAGVAPHARYVVYRSYESSWLESIDMADALHPQTLVTYGMNDGDLPVAFGGPIRLRVPRQLGYKSVKFITSMTVTDDLSRFGKNFGSGALDAGYAWYAGI